MGQYLDYTSKRGNPDHRSNIKTHEWIVLIFFLIGFSLLAAFVAFALLMTTDFGRSLISVG